MNNIKEYDIAVSYLFTDLINQTTTQTAYNKLEQTKEFINVIQALLKEDIRNDTTIFR